MFYSNIQLLLTLCDVVFFMFLSSVLCISIDMKALCDVFILFSRHYVMTSFLFLVYYFIYLLKFVFFLLCFCVVCFVFKSALTFSCFCFGPTVSFSLVFPFLISLYTQPKMYSYLKPLNANLIGQI